MNGPVYLGKQPPIIGCGDPGDPIEFSCRFDGTGWLYRDIPQNGNRKKWQISAFVKRTDFTTINTFFAQLDANNLEDRIVFKETNKLFWNLASLGPASTSEHLFRDPATHGLLEFIYDSDQPVQSARLTAFYNGVKISEATSYPVNLGHQTIINSVERMGIGKWPKRYDHYFKGYMSAFHFFDGIIPGPLAIGYLNSYGHVVPKKYTGAFGQNGFHLDFADPLDLGRDASGNGNHFQSPGMTPANQSRDTPTNNFWTINPLENSGFLSGTISDGNTRTQAYGGTSSFFHNLSYPIPKKGIWCWEQKIISGGSSFYPGYGIATPDYKSVVRYRYSGSSTNLYLNGTPTAYAAGNAAVGDVFGFQFDADNLVLKIFNNGVLESTHNVQQEDWCVAQNDRASSISQGNYGDDPFEHPEVFSEDAQTLKIPNIDCPDILNPDDYFSIRQRANGDDVSDLPWNPQNVKTLVLSKCISASTNWRAVDTLNGAGKAWETNTSNAQIIENDGLTGFIANGYTVGSNLAYQGIRKDYIWRADPKAGFDIVLINHVNGVPSTVPHNCGGPVDYAWAVPHSGGNRRIYHKKLPSGKYAHLNVATTPATDSGWFSSTANNVTLNGSLPSGVYTLYIWREVAQFSSFDGHPGNQSADGPFEPKDFTPRLLFCRKAAYGESNWMQEFEGVNPVTKMRYLNDPAGEYSHSSGYSIDFDSNGFKWRTADTSWNASGVEFITASWAQTPFKFARAQ